MTNNILDDEWAKYMNDNNSFDDNDNDNDTELDLNELVSLDSEMENNVFNIDLSKSTNIYISTKGPGSVEVTTNNLPNFFPFKSIAFILINITINHKSPINKGVFGSYF